ncbi:glycine cleavage system protein GcvH [Desulfitobacterium sp.]|uniref:glycine cleavage system protein GcvH n=1 Tax=Desulfitobacterium sp. TaxID=49981 RepID=UPI002B1E9598|nr:glycine cleavage system protein GcvH [Desulfitobacterium sp.]MEA4901591.1 glycine cleavage system protein GcvH [Desulfitobacterium sp.]
MKVDKYNYPEGYYYDKHHFWARIEDDVVIMGMTEYATNSAGDLVFIEMVEPGKKVQQDKAFLSVESGKWVGRVFAPVSGEIVEVNEELEFEPMLVNQDPYDKGWIVKIKPSQLEMELANLLTVENLSEWLEPEIERQKKLQAKKGF